MIEEGALDQHREYLENVRAGTIVAALYNSLDEIERPGVDLEDIFPDTSVKPTKTWRR